MNRTLRGLIAVIAISQFGCASYFLRKECEKTNWREHGNKVAMSGKRLDADPFINQCQKVEAEISHQQADLGFKEGMNRYCSLDQVFQVGKSGKTFNFDMCDGLPIKAMKKRFADGLRLYCQADNGYPVGASGATYENVCPKESEPAFLTEYRRGRKVYLSTVISEKEKQVDELDDEVSRLQRDRDQRNYELNRFVSNNRVIEHERKWDPATNSYKEEVRSKEDESTKNQREELERSVRRITDSIHSAEAKKRTLREEIRQMRTEMVAL